MRIVKQKFAGKPWLTNGIQNECKKKNHLYKEFLKKRTTEAENIYKNSKNKLTRIMRTSKRDYNCKSLEDNKSDFKQTLKVLNKIIKQKLAKTENSNYLLAKNNIFTDMNLVADGFNAFFCGCWCWSG